MGDKLKALLIGPAGQSDRGGNAVTGSHRPQDSMIYHIIYIMTPNPAEIKLCFQHSDR